MNEDLSYMKEWGLMQIFTKMTEKLALLCSGIMENPSSLTKPVRGSIAVTASRLFTPS
jgi:hypothetical protein